MKADDVTSGKQVLRAIKERVGPWNGVAEYLDKSGQNSVDIADFLDLPESGQISYCTTTLHAYPNLLDGVNKPVELIMISKSSDRDVANVVATSAFNVGKDQWLAAPGVVFPDVVSAYFTDTTVPNVMWNEPFVWPELSTLHIETVGNVHCLLGVPITDSELKFLRERGYFELSDAFDEAQVEYTDLYRASVV